LDRGGGAAIRRLLNVRSVLEASPQTAMRLMPFSAFRFSLSFQRVTRHDVPRMARLEHLETGTLVKGTTPDATVTLARQRQIRGSDVLEPIPRDSACRVPKA